MGAQSLTLSRVEGCGWIYGGELACARRGCLYQMPRRLHFNFHLVLLAPRPPPPGTFKVISSGPPFSPLGCGGGGRHLDPRISYEVLLTVTIESTVKLRAVHKVRCECLPCITVTQELIMTLLFENSQ